MHRTDNLIAQVKTPIVENPQKGTRDNNTQPGVSDTIIWRILWHDLDMSFVCPVFVPNTLKIFFLI